jgi:hypothetical protein
MAYSGLFKPKNPKKYVGDVKNIVYRSSWELKFMMYLDGHPDILEWASEEIVVWYVSPVDGRPHRYFPDFVVTKRDRTGKQERLMIEIKPSYQTKPPRGYDPRRKRDRARFLREATTWSVNKAKWDAAEAFCEERGWRFVKMTEAELGV